jgi:hypothetical protein
MKRAIATAAVAVSLTGCGGIFGSAGGTASPSGNSSAAARPETCTIYAQQHAAQVIVSPGHQSECDTLISDLTGGGIIWSFTPNGNSTSNLTQQCDVTNVGYEAVVLDDSGASVGQATCSGFETAGWTAGTQPGPLARYLAAQQQASQQQQASASASVVQGQQAGSAQQALSHDVGTLESASLALGGSKSVAGGVTQMRRDYAQEQSDYQREQRASCPAAAGDAQTVAGDAATVTSDLNTLKGDIENLQAGDIQTVQGDLSSVNSDLSSLQSLGAAAAVNSAPAVAAANKALTSAWAVISSAQDQGKAINGGAQALVATAQSWATRHGC